MFACLTALCVVPARDTACASWTVRLSAPQDTQRADTGHVPYDTVLESPHAQVSAAAVHRVCCMQL